MIFLNQLEKVKYICKLLLHILRALVTGGFARVCLCLHKPSSQYFALKMLSSNEVTRPKEMEHVKCEMDILQVGKFAEMFDIYLI